MSGCGCGTPVVVNAPTPARVDVETLLLCDVLADGTATPVLVEPIYDTSTGTRVGTRTVDPETGADYTVQGELTLCPESPCGCQTIQLCDVLAPSSDTAFYPISAGSGACFFETGSDAGGGPCALPNGITVNPSVGFAHLYQGPVDELGVILPSTTLAVSAPARIRFQVSVPEGQGLRLPDGAQVVSLASVHTWDPATGVLTGGPGAGSSGEDVRDAPRSVILVPYTEGATFQRSPAGSNVAPYLAGIEVAPALPRPFLRTFCRTCGSDTVTVTDTELDGTTLYEVRGTPGTCLPEAPTPCDSHTELLCDTVPGTPVATADLPLTPVAVTVQPYQQISGNPQNGTLADGQAIFDGQAVTVPASTPDAAGLGAHTHYAVRLDPGTPDCGTLDPAGTAEVTVSLTAQNQGPGAACQLYGRLSMWDGNTLVGQSQFTGGLAAGATVPAAQSTLTGTVPVASLQAGTITVEFDVETGGDTGCGQTADDVKSWAVSGATVTATASVTDCTTGGGQVKFLRRYAYDCTTGAPAGYTNLTLDGEVYEVQGTVAQCEEGCASPTTPVTTVGLCLADGTPIAVTVVRNCDGAVTSEGWINLSTGSWTAGAVPVGTVACGESRSIQVSGTFCDIDAAGEVVGLVLVEYTYDDTGAIASVRLVDAVTGGTYTPAGTVTVCPAGVEQPEQDAVILCDVQADGTSVPMVRDYRRDENGAIVAHSDYTLDGAAYAPTGTVGVCVEPCLNCETIELCDSTPGCAPGTAVADADWSPRYLTAADSADPGIVAVRKDVPGGGAGFWGGDSTVFPNNAADPDPGNAGLHYGIAGTITAADACPACLAPDDEVTITASGQAMNDGPGDGFLTDGRFRILRDGGEADGAVPQLAMVTDSNRPAGTAWAFTATATVPWADVLAGRIVLTLDLETKSNGAFKAWTASGFDLCITPVTPRPGCGNRFLRVVCRDCTGAIASTTDYETDGVTPYAPVEPVGACVSCTPAVPDCETEQLCDVQTDATAVLPSFGVPTESWQDLPNGVRWMRRGADGAAPGGWYGADASTPERFDFDRPVSITYSVRFSGPTAAPLRIPAGWYLDSINTGQHAWNAATRTISPTASATQAGVSTFRIEAQTAQTMIAPVVVGTQPSGQTSQYGQITVTADQVTLFLRTLCRDSAGTVTTTDTLPDGVTPYTVLGTAGRCTETPPPPCRDCETLVLCDDGADDPATITGTGASTGTLSNGVTWTSRGSSAVQSASYDGGAGEGSWWPGIYSFPNATIGNHTWSFDRPSYVEFSVYMRWVNYTGGDASNPNPRNATRVPANVEVVSLPDGYSYDPVNHLVWVDESRGDPGNEPCANLTAPTIAESARFRTTEPVSSVTTRYLGVRVATCGQFGSQRVGAFSVDPTGQFLRTICRDCDGAVASVTDTALDGQTPYTVVGTAKSCPQTIDGSVSIVGPVEVTLAEDCCQPVQVCIQQDTTQEVEFISNEEHRNDNTVDPVWKWTTDLNAANPPWYDMYQRQYSGAWSVVDSDTERPAWWVSPHPNGTSAQSSPPLPNEGPTLLNAHWYPRAYFDLPDNADPATIRVQATVFNADQIGRAFRLNNGAWQTLPATATHNGTTYTFGPDIIPGAQAGRNHLYLDVEETVGGGSGLMVHLIVTYEVIPETRSWTRMICCDGTVYYLDEDGQRQDTVPDGWHLAPCFPPQTAGTSTPVDTDAPVQTGIRRVTGTVAQALKTEFPGLQSVSLSVLAGTVNVTMTNGAAQPVPAGATMTWSCADTDDSSLALATFAGAAAGADYLLNWTNKAGAAG